ncbi:MAG: trypsin-like peptidase domain-containing protein [Planctomycetota bacterium]|nr:trypsin-like peptidase domain-containing protein [Planctomycetota bacterium]
MAWALLTLAVAWGESKGADDAVLAAQKARVDVVNKCAPSVVAIFGPGGGGGGSGVLITRDGYALTNFHVTSGAGDFMKCGLNDGVLYDAVIVGIDPTGDVALVKLFGRDDFPVATLGDSDQLAAGDAAFAMGNPFLLATDFSPTVTFGIVSGVHRYQGPAGTFLEYTDCIQVDASINPGNSGGPLFNSDGELVGINGRGSFEKRGRVNSGAGYAISINQIKNFLDHLRGGLIVDHATLGAAVVSKEDGAVIVSNILDASEAFRRGLRADDEIASFAGRPIRSVNQFKNILGIYPKGWKLPLVYRREGRKSEILVRLRGLHRQSELTLTPPDRPADQPGPDDKDKGKKKPGGPRPNAKPPQKPKPKPPEQYAKFLVERPGFANYYFNQIERTRVLGRLSAWGDFKGAAGAWKLKTHAIAADVSADFTISDNIVGLILDGGKQAFAQETTAEAKYEDEPPGTGGLLLALSHVRWLLVHGPEGFSECYYAGSEPLDGTGPLVDVVYAERYSARTRFLFDKGTGALVGSDTERDDDVDPCELRFDGLMNVGERRLPQQITVHHGDREYGRFQLKEAALATP